MAQSRDKLVLSGSHRRERTTIMHEGRIGRALRELLLTHPDEAFSTDELCDHCYGLPVERKPRVAVLRAIDKVLADLPDWTGRRGLDNILVFFNVASIESTAKGDFKRHNLRRPRDRQQW